MITIYICDADWIYSHSIEQSEYLPLPSRSTLTPPPTTTGLEVARLVGTVWEVLPERPVKPVPEPEPEPEPVPEEVEGWQAEVAMRATPVDPDDPESQSVWDRVQDIIAAMPDGIEKITAQTVLARGKIRRDSPMLAQLAPLVPLSEERVDDLMRLAASIEA
jgi:hypothetical protein